jgi:hypothetical protein
MLQEPLLLELLELSYDLKELLQILQPSELFYLNVLLLQHYLLFLSQVLETHPS